METKKHRAKQLNVFALTLCLVTLIAASGFIQSGEIAYPEGFRSWMHVKSALIQKGNPAYAHWGGFHHIYANEKGVEGYRSGKFPDGSVLVFDVLEANAKDSLVTEGKRKLVDVMVRNADLYKTTGGWGYEEFGGDSKTDKRIGALAVTACYNCHAHQKANDNVFSKLRD